jgi:hypothetical protein
MIDVMVPIELQPMLWWLRGRVAATSADDRGEVVPWVIIVAVTAALAIAVGAIIVAKVTSKANNINLNGGGSGS